jgi:hypothetical protein
MVAEVIEYDLDRRQVVAALQKSAREADSPVTFDDAITADAGRPIRVEALTWAFGEQTLRKSLANLADAESEASGTEYEAVTLINVEPGVPLAKAERSVLWMPGGRRELQQRLLAAIRRGDTRVSTLDVAGLDDGGRIRKAALNAVMASDEYLGNFGDADLTGGEPLAKSRRPSKIEVALEFYQGRANADAEAPDMVRALKKSLAAKGYDVNDAEAQKLARLVGPRRVTCNADRTACAVR